MRRNISILACILLLSVFTVSIEIVDSKVLSNNDFPDGWQIIGIYDEFFEDADKIKTAPVYLQNGDIINLNLTVIPQADQNSGVAVEIHTPIDVIYIAENRSNGIKTINESVVLNASFTEGNYWFEVINPGSPGGDQIWVSGMCYYYHVDTIPDPITPYDAFQVGNWLTYQVDHQYDIRYDIISRDPAFIQFDNDNPFSTGWDTIIVPIIYQPPFDDLFFVNILDRNFLPFNYNLSYLEQNNDSNTIFYNAQSLVQTTNGIIITENIILNGSSIIYYITTIEYTIAELIPIRGVTWKYNDFNDSDGTWTNYSVQLQVHEPTGIPILLDMAVSKTDHYLDQKFSYFLKESKGFFEINEFPLENITDYVYITNNITITEIINNTVYITINNTNVIDVTEISYTTEIFWVTRETLITKQTTDFVALVFVALAMMGLTLRRRKKS